MDDATRLATSDTINAALDAATRDAAEQAVAALPTHAVYDTYQATDMQFEEHTEGAINQAPLATAVTRGVERAIETLSHAATRETALHVDHNVGDIYQQANSAGVSNAMHLAVAEAVNGTVETATYRVNHKVRDYVLNEVDQLPANTGTNTADAVNEALHVAVQQAVAEAAAGDVRRDAASDTAAALGMYIGNDTTNPAAAATSPSTIATSHGVHVAMAEATDAATVQLTDTESVNFNVAGLRARTDIETRLGLVSTESKVMLANRDSNAAIIAAVNMAVGTATTEARRDNLKSVREAGSDMALTEQTLRKIPGISQPVYDGLSTETHKASEVTRKVDNSTRDATHEALAGSTIRGVHDHGTIPVIRQVDGSTGVTLMAVESALSKNWARNSTAEAETATYQGTYRAVGTGEGIPPPGAVGTNIGRDVASAVTEQAKIVKKQTGKSLIDAHNETAEASAFGTGVELLAETHIPVAGETQANTSAVYQATSAAMPETIQDLIAYFVGEELTPAIIKELPNWWRMYQGGNMWASGCAYLAGARDVLGLELPSHKAYQAYEDCAIEGGFRMMHADFCMVSDRPLKISIDAENRPHCENGPSHLWRDGWALYHWHGVAIPEAWVTGNPPSAAEALGWPNIEQRRAACELVGWVHILDQLQAKTIDQDGDPEIGSLLEVELPDAGRARFIYVQCGTGRRFALPVPLNMQTALQGNAWSYGLDGDMVNFKPEVRT